MKGFSAISDLLFGGGCYNRASQTNPTYSTCAVIPGHARQGIGRRFISGCGHILQWVHRGIQSSVSPDRRLRAEASQIFFSWANESIPSIPPPPPPHDHPHHTLLYLATQEKANETMQAISRDEFTSKVGGHYPTGNF